MACKIEVVFPKSEDDHARLRKLWAEGKLTVGGDDWMRDIPPEDGYLVDPATAVAGRGRGDGNS